MSNSTPLYGQLMVYLRQYSRYCDVRHLKALAWMVSALLCCGKLSLPEWEPYVVSRAQKAQSVERRWSRFLSNERIDVAALYVPKSVGCFEWMATASTVSGTRHHGAVESLLYDSPVGSLLWTSRSLAVASVRAPVQ